jgi:signal peptidase I
MPLFASRSIKHARLLLRHADKLRRYRRDVMTEAELADLDRHIAELRRAIKNRDERMIREKSEQLDAIVGHQAAPHWEAGWRENTEVIVVAIIVAVAVRSYFIQPFKIPTGSMQPTLNGIVGHPTSAPPPNLLQQVVEFFVLGRNYINVVSPSDDVVKEIQPRKFLFFFTWSRVICQNQKFSVYCPPEQLQNEFKVSPGKRYKKGEVIARGAIDTGDQVFVDKFSYNFVKPRRGDVFVFRTNHILMIELRSDPDSGAPYYIKRLTGAPGDTLRIDPPLLYVNGEPAKGYGFQRVMSAQPPYRGYSLGREYLGSPEQTFTVPAHSYFAMGDNSYFSYDSRYWGPVPEQNLVGRGLAVYWPFDHHWGFIR